jgi:hypothetical protein
MTKVLMTLLLAFATLGLAAHTFDETKNATKEGAGHPGLERFKQLAGDWTGKIVHDGKPGEDVHVNYKVTSAGSAVVETITPGQEHEMVTVIHQDGSDLALTHYCALGNQPHMKTVGEAKGNIYEFKFTGASNMKSEKDMHMHSVTYTFVDKDTLKADWTHFQEGKKAGTATFDLKRKR